MEARILSMYLGCECIVKTHNKAPAYNFIQEKLTPMTLFVWTDKNYIIQPILRPLSDMTEEERIEFDDKGWFFSVPLHLKPEAFQYLLSKHFDLFGLIESGHALDKSKL